MSTDGSLICVDPAIPNSCLRNFAGWLLQAMLDSEIDDTGDGSTTHFFAEGDEKEGEEIDHDFIRYFEATSDDDPLKLALLEENEDLASKDGLAIGQEVSTFGLDLDDVIQRVVADSQGVIAAVELTVFYTAGIVRPGNIGGYCSYITADAINSLSYEDWLFEQRARHTIQEGAS